MPAIVRRASVGLVGCLLLLACAPGCGDDDGPAGPSDGGIGADAGSVSGDGGGPDSGSPRDAGPAPIDAEASTDSGTTDDAGPADVDSGVIDPDAGATDADAGPAPADGGPAPLDAGPAPVDAGPAPVDAGPAPPVDAGRPDAGRPDAGPALPTCDEYCTVIQAACTGGNQQYASRDACLTACVWAPGSIGMTSGNTIGCRLYHAGAAASDPVTHCPHAGPTGGGVCVTP